MDMNTPALHESSREDMMIAPTIKTRASPVMPEMGNPEMERPYINVIKMTDLKVYGAGRIVTSNSEM